ncbi:MAG TPA: DUF417 family protein [Gemmatimonadaceae bacterium]|nr:DUF417 family protein [Gemmatimonadaceae bacterium]
MTTAYPVGRAAALPVASRLRGAADQVLRWGLVVIILWFAAFKFTDAEARAIEPLLRGSPVLSWLYAFTDVRGASRLVGVAELTIAALLMLRPLDPRFGVAGGIAAAAMFVTTLSFLATTPGMFARVEWIVVPSGAGGFIIKDLLLLGAALRITGEALGAATRSLPPRS